MIRCNQCNVEIRRDDSFCPNCGAKQEYDSNLGFSVPAKKQEERYHLSKWWIVIVALIILAAIFFFVVRPWIADLIQNLFTKISSSTPQIPIE